jgi:hypothetical protein
MKKKKKKTKYLRYTRKNYAMDSMHLKQVKSFKYLGSIVNGNNSIEEEIKKELFLAIKRFMLIRPYSKANCCQRKLN